MKLKRFISLFLVCSLAVSIFTAIPAAAEGTEITQDNPSGTLTITLKIKGTASVTTAPTAKEGLTTSNGVAVELLETRGTAEGGTMAYSLNGTDYSADIPTADAAGTYTVYYKAIGDEDHNDSEAQTLTVTVGASGALTITLTITPDDVVINQINALPAKDDVTLDDKADIEAARAAYDALTDDQKAKVDAETLKKLTDAETALAAAEKDAADTKAANDVTDTINALPVADKVTTADKDAIEAARKAYDDLTDDQKAKVDAETLKKLTDAETALAAAEKDAADTAAANTVSEAINDLPNADKVTTADKDAIEAARKAYDDLTDDQKAKVSEDTLKKLTDDEKALEELKKASLLPAPSVKNYIDAGKKQVTVDITAVKGATDYKIIYRKQGATKWTSVNTKGKTKYVVNKLDSNGAYEFRVRAYVKQNGKTAKTKWSHLSRRFIADVTLNKPTAAKGSAKVSWSKNAKASGYEVIYSTKRDMSGSKSVTVKGGSKTSYTIKNLKSGKKYYVRVRAFITKGGQNFNGPFADVKSIIVK